MTYTIATNSAKFQPAPWVQTAIATASENSYAQGLVASVSFVALYAVEFNRDWVQTGRLEKESKAAAHQAVDIAFEALTLFITACHWAVNAGREFSMFCNEDAPILAEMAVVVYQMSVEYATETAADYAREQFSDVLEVCDRVDVLKLVGSVSIFALNVKEVVTGLQSFAERHLMGV